MHGQCNARPTVTFQAAKHHHSLAGTKLYCLVNRGARVWTTCLRSLLAVHRLRVDPRTFRSPVWPVTITLSSPHLSEIGYKSSSANIQAREVTTVLILHKNEQKAGRRITLQVVVVRILSHASVEKRPRQVVNCILLVLNGPSHNLGVEMIMQKVIQMRLHTTTTTHNTFSADATNPATITTTTLYHNTSSDGSWCTATYQHWRHGPVITQLSESLNASSDKYMYRTAAHNKIQTNLSHKTASFN